MPVVEEDDYARLDLDLLDLRGIQRLSKVVICQSFPRNEMGKLDRNRLREIVVKLAEKV